MADKPKTNVDKFFEIYDADPALQARVQQAMDSYPGSLEIRDVMTEHVLLPVAEELGCYISILTILSFLFLPASCYPSNDAFLPVSSFTLTYLFIFF